MALIESLQKKIDQIDRYAKFYQSLLIAVLTGLGWSIYAILEDKIKNIIILDGMGILIAILLAIKIKSLNEYQNELIEKLKEN